MADTAVTAEQLQQLLRQITNIRPVCHRY